MTYRKLLLATATLTLMGAASPVLAQTSTDTVSEIVVTGSRIATKNLSSNSPITTVAQEQFQATPAVTLEATLNQLPQLVPSTGSFTNDSRGGGAVTLNLRGLGSARTLVLVDGRRVSGGAADIDSIPQALIQGVDVITGGASAAYGSDAVAGVVNFKLDHHFTGFKANAQYGVSGKGDGTTEHVDLTVGGNFAEDRGNGVISLNWDHREAINNSDRSFSTIVRPSSTYPYGSFAPSATNLPTQAAYNAVFAKYGIAAGTVTPSTTLGFNNDGTLFRPSGGLNYKGGAANVILVNGTPFYNSTGVAGLQLPFDRFGGYGRGEYALTDHIDVYGEASLQSYKSGGLLAPAPTSFTVPVSNPFIPADLAALLASRPNSTAGFSESYRTTGLGFRKYDFNTTNYRLTAGLTVRLDGIDGTFDAHAMRAQNHSTEKDYNNYSVSALNALLNATDGGKSVCSGGFNPFGEQANSACYNYIRRTAITDTTETYQDLEATLQGRLFNLPAGEVRFALGGDHHETRYAYVPDSGMQTGDIVGLSSGVIPQVNGSIKLNEVYGELLIPVVKNLPLIQKFELNLGYRYSDYNSFGGANTYRVQGDWTLNDALRIRGGYSRAIRAPTVTDLFQPQTPNSPVIGTPGASGQGDPCDVRSSYRTGSNAAQVRALCLAQGLPASVIDTYTFTNTQVLNGAVTGGNPNLKSEIADTYTAGVVLTPKFNSALFGRMSGSIDYYVINLKEAIGSIPSTTIIQNCYNLSGLNPSYAASNAYCSLFTRDAATGNIANLQLNSLNLGHIKTSGLDFAADWRFGLDAVGLSSSAGSLAFNANVTRVFAYKVQNFAGGPIMDQAGSIGATAYPKWKALVNATYSISDWEVGVRYRYIAKMIDVSAIGVTNSSATGTPAMQYVDANVRWNMRQGVSLRAGVNNLFDKQPPVYTSFSQSNTNPEVFDVIGRAYFVGLTLRY